MDNLAEGIHKLECKDCTCFLEYKNVKDNLIRYKCLSWNKYYGKQAWWKIKKRFRSTFKFSNSDINKFILLLWKDAYPYEYRDEWENFNETPLPEK